MLATSNGRIAARAARRGRRRRRHPRRQRHDPQPALALALHPLDRRPPRRRARPGRRPDQAPHLERLRLRPLTRAPADRGTMLARPDSSDLGEALREGGKDAAMQLDRDRAARRLSAMRTIRGFEEKLAELVHAGQAGRLPPPLRRRGGGRGRRLRAPRRPRLRRLDAPRPRPLHRQGRRRARHDGRALRARDRHLQGQGRLDAHRRPRPRHARRERHRRRRASRSRRARRSRRSSSKTGGVAVAFFGDGATQPGRSSTRR